MLILLLPAVAFISTMTPAVPHEAKSVYAKSKDAVVTIDTDTKRGSTWLKVDLVRIRLDLGAGDEATIYTCDLGYGHVRIIAEHHT